MQGGNKTKAMAKSTPYEKSASRIPLSQEEKYGIIKSVSGSGRFRVLSPDNKLYVGILPGSMRGHKKRNNYVGLDTIVLINDRSSWQTIKDNSHADIVYVYTYAEINRLHLHSLFQGDIPPVTLFQGDIPPVTPFIGDIHGDTQGDRDGDRDQDEDQEVNLDFI